MVDGSQRKRGERIDSCTLCSKSIELIVITMHETHNYAIQMNITKPMH